MTEFLSEILSVIKKLKRIKLYAQENSNLTLFYTYNVTSTTGFVRYVP
jgi:hypothetical protein